MVAILVNSTDTPTNKLILPIQQLQHNLKSFLNQQQSLNAANMR